ncbi:MAG TPA: ABC transporter ATP-binding protein [Chlamydiales bacterium]|nr:ABC transporter ATP-binding protein [Chlamydiales bacterium]
MKEPLLKGENICKSFSSYPVLSDISLELHAGESIAISGRSGEGKTTLLHILGTLEEPDKGTLEIEGKLCTPSNAPLFRKRSIGFIFQAFYLLEDFTALENVLMPAAIDRRKITQAQGLALLEKVNLTNRANFPVKLLSGGERQRVAIARALCNDPQIILADEPSGNLDTENGKAIGDLLLSLSRSEGKGLIVVTHDSYFASCCDKSFRLAQGKLL